jgi:4-diphosphocytidyl-2-C-methyl-D-erythritol kinase
VPRPRPRWVLLVLPSIDMPTAEVYRRFDAMRLGRVADIEIEPDWIAWSKLDAGDLMARLVNDLEAPAFSINDHLAALRDMLQEMLGRAVRMSGSGSSLFTLYDTADEANRGREAITRVLPMRVEVVELTPEFRDDLNDNP